MYEFFTDDFAGLSAFVWNWIATAICILFLVLLVMGLLRILRGPKLGGRKGRNARLAVTDATAIGDDRRKLVLVRRDNVEHLLLIGGPSDLVIETNIIKPVAPSQITAPPAKQVSEFVKKASRKDPALLAPEPEKPATTTEAKPAPVVAPTKPVASPEPAPQPAVAATPSIAPQVTAPATSTQQSSTPSTLAAAAAVVAAPIVAASTDEKASIPEESTGSDSAPNAETETIVPENTDEKRNPVEEMDALLKEISTDK